MEGLASLPISLAEDVHAQSLGRKRRRRASSLPAHLPLRSTKPSGKQQNRAKNPSPGENLQQLPPSILNPRGAAELSPLLRTEPTATLARCRRRGPLTRPGSSRRPHMPCVALFLIHSPPFLTAPSADAPSPQPNLAADPPDPPAARILPAPAALPGRPGRRRSMRRPPPGAAGPGGPLRAAQPPPGPRGAAGAPLIPAGLRGARPAGCRSVLPGAPAGRRYLTAPSSSAAAPLPPPAAALPLTPSFPPPTPLPPLCFICLLFLPFFPPRSCLVTRLGTESGSGSAPVLPVRSRARDAEGAGC